MAKKKVKDNVDEKIKLTCTGCGRNVMLDSNYYKASSSLYSHYGSLSVCRNCVIKIFDYYMKEYDNNLMKATYYTCRKLDVCFRLADYQGALKQYENENKKRKDTFFFGVYMTKLNSIGNINHGQADFDDSDNLIDDNDEEILKPQDISSVSIDDELLRKWGDGFSDDEYIFLEKELTQWKKTHKCDNQAELTLLKEICITILEIRNARGNSNSTKTLRKDLQDLMKTASVDPAKANAISDSQTVDRFGVWIKDIERFKPSEWWENQEKYKDMDGFLPYINDYIVRPIKNFFTGTKDFLVENKDLSFNEEDSNE